jgi:hypothetical protein
MDLGRVKTFYPKRLDEVTRLVQPGAGHFRRFFVCEPTSAQFQAFSCSAGAAPMATGRSRSGNFASRSSGSGTSPRICDRITHSSSLHTLLRFTIAKKLASGAVGFYFNIPTHYRRLFCSIRKKSLGTDYAVACGENGDGGLAAALNAMFDEWNATRLGQPVDQKLTAFGTVDRLFREYKKTKAYLEKVSQRSRRDYEGTMQIVVIFATRKGDRVGIAK